MSEEIKEAEDQPETHFYPIEAYSKPQLPPSEAERSSEQEDD
jgi:hypothetical protein